MNNAAENKDQTAYLRLMLDAFEKIKSFIGVMSCETFFIDSKTQSAVIMKLQVVGELAKKVDEKINKEIFSQMITIAHAAIRLPTSLVPCGTSANPAQCNPCHLWLLADNVINFILWMSLPILVIALLYGGIIWLISVGKCRHKEGRS